MHPEPNVCYRPGAASGPREQQSLNVKVRGCALCAVPHDCWVGRHGAYTSLRIGFRPAICSRIKTLRPFNTL